MKIKSLFVIFFFTALLSMAQTDTTQKAAVIYTEPVAVGNSGVTILPPAYFEVSENFTGFMHKGAGASIQISTTDGKPFPIMAQALVDKDNLEKLGITLISQEKVLTKAGKEAIMIVIGFTIKGPGKDFAYERIVLLTGDYNHTIMVNANYPLLAKGILFEVIKQSVLTVAY